MDYDGNSTLYHLNCGICGRTFWSHDAFESVCDDCKYTDTPILYPNGYLESKNGDVEIVRCKNCRWGDRSRNGKGEEMILCYNGDTGIEDGYLHEPDWFCAEGERKEGR